MDTRVKQEVLGWTRDHVLPSEPHEEYIPYLAWFRALSVNNQRWVLYWPELEI